MKRNWRLFIASVAAVSMAMASVSCDDEKDENESELQGHGETDPSNPSDNGNDKNVEREYVDLGLPSGTLWATYNIGATKPEEYGSYFAWGETEPKEMYDWSTYKHAGGMDSLTKYNSGNWCPGVIDSLTTLLAEDDAATANWGSDWRMPTTEEQRELINNCQYEWTEVGGVSGAKFTASNGNSIFLPAAGRRDGSDVNYVGGEGYYWSSSLDEAYERIARFLSFGEDGEHMVLNDRYLGCPVRAVRAKK